MSMSLKAEVWMSSFVDIISWIFTTFLWNISLVVSTKQYTNRLKTIPSKYKMKKQYSTLI